MGRFNIDRKRIYVAGMSGGSRVALYVALQSDSIAGVIASSAGYPDSRPRKTLDWRTPAEALDDHLLACTAPESSRSP